MNLTNYGENKVVDAVWRDQALGAPATKYIALLTTTDGPLARSTLYATNDTVSVTVGGLQRLYKCTTGGTTASSAPSYPGVAGEAITDGTAVFTEQSPELDAGTAQAEPSGGDYARASVVSSLTNFAGTQSAGSTTASSGTGGQTSNNGAITFPPPDGANWGFIWGWAVYDASTAGNCWVWAGLTIPKTVNDGDSAPSFAAGQLTYTQS
jgi:hypothetical protein